MCCSDREYPRLGQMIVDYENPLKKMMEEFVPHGKVEKLLIISGVPASLSVYSALSSVNTDSY